MRFFSHLLFLTALASSIAPIAAQPQKQLARSPRIQSAKSICFEDKTGVDSRMIGTSLFSDRTELSVTTASRFCKNQQFGIEFSHRKCIIRLREEKPRVDRFGNLRIYRICLLVPQRLLDLVPRYSLS
jgi:hypothetical protein